MKQDTNPWSTCVTQKEIEPKSIAQSLDFSAVQDHCSTGNPRWQFLAPITRLNKILTFVEIQSLMTLQSQSKLLEPFQFGVLLDFTYIPYLIKFVNAILVYPSMQRIGLRWNCIRKSVCRFSFGPPICKYPPSPQTKHCGCIHPVKTN